ncbi:MAG: sugar phosphate isomerase/epimerase [Chthoniobacterales bacterium]|nr:sugar phosphate isomerase/epimerase [Chthoniobacterales bacterium]
MKLSLSGRLWQTSDGYSITLREHIALARQFGYEGLEVRHPMLPGGDEIGAIKSLLCEARLVPVFCFCAGLPRTEASWSDALRVAETMQALGGEAVRVAVTQSDELEVVRDLAVRLDPLGLAVLVHNHLDTLCDTTEKSLAVLEKIGHPRVRLLLDCAHLLMAEETNLPRALERLLPWVDVVNVQNVCRAEGGNIRGTHDCWRHVPPHHPGGIAFSEILRHLQYLGFDGWLNVMTAVSPDEDAAAFAKDYWNLLDEGRKISPQAHDLQARPESPKISHQNNTKAETRGDFSGSLD